MNFTFTQATKEEAKARVALTGPSGSGKTYTALTIATTLGKKVAVIDTERGSASKYADEFAFDKLNLQTFEPTTLCQALAAAAASGYEVVIVDSLTHFWSGTGGMLEQVDAAAKRGYGGNSFGGWKEARPQERAMIDALVAYPGHVIVTMRSKTDYVIEEDQRGRKVPRKVGLKPEQREGIEYEFDIVGDLDHENTLVVTKSRARKIANRVVAKPGAEFAQEIADWLGDGKPSVDALHYRDLAVVPTATREDLSALANEVKERGLLGAAVIDEHGEATSLGDLIRRRWKEAPAEAGEKGGEAA
ncbi:ATP-binding protein [Microbispora triticiradicis]|uniref:ATP-binding protein n=1 Tax=Microbispora triticiradicis TaxID=2200763 RepID=UPI001AD7616F|nr:ATP-binding protein [Microbispora triticiradicis]MBO4275495.1 AAA family ATPase [Microbispora triticiradicis]